jgi:hypothetical protein
MHRLIELLGVAVQGDRHVRMTAILLTLTGSSPSLTIRCEMKVLHELP